MSRRRNKPAPREDPPEPVEYTLTAKGEVLGTVVVRRSRERLFMGYFHPIRAFSRIVGLFDEYNRAIERYDRLKSAYRVGSGKCIYAFPSFSSRNHVHGMRNPDIFGAAVATA